MFLSRKRIFLKSHLTILYKCFLCFGFLHFKYNPESQKFEYSKFNNIVSVVLHNCLKYILGAEVIKMLVLQFFNFLVVHLEYPISDAIASQERVLFWPWLNFYPITGCLVALNWITFRDIILPTLNETLDIFHQLKSKLNSSINAERKFLLLLALKFFLLVIRSEFFIAMAIFGILYEFEFFHLHAIVLFELLFFSHIYSQLVLISFYDKLNKILELFDLAVIEERHATKCVKNLISISFRIHCLKNTFDTCFTYVLIATYCRLFVDIRHLYDALKIVVYSKYRYCTMPKWKFLVQLIFHDLPLSCTVSYDLYLVGLLSDMLIRSEAEFMKNVLEIYLKRRLLTGDTWMEQEIESMFLQCKVFELSTTAHGRIKFDRNVSFEKAINALIVYGMACLQFYAGEAIYPRKADEKLNSDSNCE